MARFCRNCGTQASADTKFCQNCGAKLDEPVAAAAAPRSSSPASAAEAPQTPRAPAPAAAPAGGPAVGSAASTAKPAKSGGGCAKVVLVVVSLFLVLCLVVVGGVVYFAYRAKKKVDEVREAYKLNDINKMAEALGGKPSGSKPVQPMPTFPDWVPSNAEDVQPSASAVNNGGLAGNSPIIPTGGSGEKSYGGVVPVMKGVTMTAAVQEALGDYETLIDIKSVTNDGVLMNLSSDNVPVPTNPFDKQSGNQGQQPKTTSVRGQRKVLPKDMESAHEYAEEYSPIMPLTFPGTFSLGFSREMFNDLNTTGETPFTYWQVGLKGALGSLLNGLGAMPGMENQAGNVPGGAPSEAQKELENFSKVHCTLKRTDQRTYSFPVLITGERRLLPALRASCVNGDDHAEFYYVDDPDNALILSWQIGQSERAQIIKIDYTAAENAGGREGKGAGGGAAGGGGAGEAAAAKQLEEKLANQEKVQIYGIYFDFASAKIKPQSKPTLDEIADVMKTNPDWKLNVDGHTDNIGGDAFNLDLSQKRAAAVKSVLVEQYHIAPERLTTAGYGASRPVESNDTMEGRARNRRVELSRQ
jgi:outer membrane protein OmpA-like peptidoglycan-associated protein